MQLSMTLIHPTNHVKSQANDIDLNLRTEKNDCWEGSMRFTLKGGWWHTHHLSIIRSEI